MDCFRSGRDMPVEDAVFDGALPERLTGVEAWLPKKSSPINDSPGRLFCFEAG